MMPTIDLSTVPDVGGVYVLQATGFPAVNIGSSPVIRSRVASLQAAIPMAILFLGFIEEPSAMKAKEIEASLHRRFAILAMHGEWFQLHGAGAAIDDMNGWLGQLRGRPLDRPRREPRTPVEPVCSRDEALAHARGLLARLDGRRS